MKKVALRRSAERDRGVCSWDGSMRVSIFRVGSGQYRFECGLGQKASSTPTMNVVPG